MSFRDLLETGQALALASKLYPDEIAIWDRYCRDYSKLFHTPLMEVRSLDPLFVISQVDSENLSDLNVEERLQDIQDTIAGLFDPNYDAKKEAAIREELRQIEEHEKLRLERGEAIHPSLEKDKRVITKDQPKQMPKEGGVNMNLVNQLMNSDKES